MKKRFVSILLAAMTISMSVTAYAAPSISQLIPEAPTVISGAVNSGEQLIVQNANTDAYTNKTVAETVKKVNDENTKTTMKEILADLQVDTKTVVLTENKKLVNPTLYEPVTPFVDLVLKKEDEIKYQSTGEIKASITIEAAKDMNKKDALIMQIDPNTGKVHFIAIEELNKATGEVTATFPTLGPIALLEKVPVVVKNVSPEKYVDQKIAEVVEKFREEKSNINLFNVLENLVDTVEKEIEISVNKKINIDDFSSAMGFADLAIKQGEDEYLYDMDGELEAEAHRDLKDTDWERIVTAQDSDFDVEAAKENPELLTELDPFVLEDSFVMQMNPITGDVDYIEEPTISFAYPETEETAEDSETVENENEDSDNELMRWTIHDEDKEEEDMPNLVINAKFTSMGPFAIFMPKTK
ncbi:hypothetical protein [Ruminococcus sp. 5_1_39BFAA]|uniref:hypothetical protein n=1 Tax=Ruminococcus sp. 5_1_39BFAA TaxID=457412 RepID=UPI0035670B85